MTTLPHSTDSEAALLGSMILDPDLVHELEFLRPEHFYRPLHRRTYEAIQELAENGVEFDGSEVTEIIKASYQVPPGFVHGLAESVTSVAAADRLARGIQRAYLLRQVHGVLSEGTRLASDWSGSVDEFLEGLFTKLEALGSGGSGDYQDTLDNVLQRVARKLHEGDTEGLHTGFPTLDRMTTGLKPGELVIIAARPSMGKSAIAFNIADYVGSRGDGVLVFSLEVTADIFATNVWASAARVNTQKLRSGLVDDVDEAALEKTGLEIGKYGKNVVVDASPSLTAGEVRMRARNVARKRDVKLIVLDYLQYLRAEKGDFSRYDSVSKMSNTLKATARELQVPLIALSQLNRGVEGRDDKRPKLSDLKESGAIEQDADVVILLNRPGYYAPDDPSLEGVGELIVAKNRNGPTGVIPMRFERECVRWSEGL